MINVGLLGCGTVGSGVVELLQKNAETIAQRTGDKIAIKKVLEKDQDKCQALGIPDDMLATDFSEIINDSDINIVVKVSWPGKRTSAPRSSPPNPFCYKLQFLISSLTVPVQTSGAVLLLHYLFCLHQ